MEREFTKKLLTWKNTNMDYPLIVIGARQIGKTYTINEFCKKNFKNYLYFNLEFEKEIYEIFEQTIDPKNIIRLIELKLEKKIDIDNTILFFDEAQNSERLITSLKYFCESEIKYKIIVCGSLLGVKLNRFNSSFPVRKSSN
ncbi:MAG: AAA family ATPase [Clostridia bacterium]